MDIFTGYEDERKFLSTDTATTSAGFAEGNTDHSSSSIMKLNVFLLKKISGVLNEQIWFLLRQRLKKEGIKNTSKQVNFV